MISGFGIRSMVNVPWLENQHCGYIAVFRKKGMKSRLLSTIKVKDRDPYYQNRRYVDICTQYRYCF